MCYVGILVSIRDMKLAHGFLIFEYSLTVDLSRCLRGGSAISQGVMGCRLVSFVFVHSLFSG